MDVLCFQLRQDDFRRSFWNIQSNADLWGRVIHLKFSASGFILNFGKFDCTLTAWKIMVSKILAKLNTSLRSRGFIPRVRKTCLFI